MRTSLRALVVQSLSCLTLDLGWRLELQGPLLVALVSEGTCPSRFCTAWMPRMAALGVCCNESGKDAEPRHRMNCSYPPLAGSPKTGYMEFAETRYWGICLNACQSLCERKSGSPESSQVESGCTMSKWICVPYAA